MARRPIVAAVAATSVACGVAFAAFVIGSIARLAGGTQVPIGGVAALVASLVLIFVAWRASPARTNATAVAVAFAVVPVLAVGSHWALAQPLAYTHVRCGTGDVAIPLAAILVLFVSSTIALPFAWLVAAHLRARVAFVAGGALTFVLGVSAFAAVRSLRHPEPEAYLATFERVSLEPGGALTTGDVTITLDPTLSASPRSAGINTCTLHVSHEGFEGDPVHIDAIDGCPHLAVYAHHPSGAVVITDATDPNRVEAVVRHGSSGQPDLDIDALRGTLGVPRGWAVTGALGFLLAFSALTFAFRNLRRARALPPIISASHEGGGWVRIDDVPRFVPALMATSPGTVAIIAPTSRTATYRNDGAAAEYEVARETSDALRARAISWAWTAAAIAMCSAVPLWVARSFGLL